jgi:long-chain acyl-CoA synthetase
VFIENILGESRFFEQAMVVGENEKFPAALVVPSFTFLKEWCGRHNIPFTTHEEVIKNEAVITRIKREIDTVNQVLAHYEQIKKFELLPKEWSIENGEMTPKLSMKRKIILSNYKSAYDKIYGPSN